MGPRAGLDGCGKSPPPSPPIEIPSPDGSARIESLYRLSYPGPSSGTVRVLKCEGCDFVHTTLNSGRDESRNALLGSL